MSEQPSHVRVWNEAQKLFEAVSEVWGHVAEMCSDDVQFCGIAADEREHLRQSLLNLDTLLSQPCYRAAITGWGRYREPPDWRQPNAGDPIQNYVLLLGTLKAGVESLLVEMTHGREERDVSFWPKCSREWHVIQERLGGLLVAIEQVPEVQAELLARARNGAPLDGAGLPEHGDQGLESAEGRKPGSSSRSSLPAKPAPTEGAELSVERTADSKTDKPTSSDPSKGPHVSVDQGHGKPDGGGHESTTTENQWLSDAERRIIDVIRKSGKRVTTKEILAELRKRHGAACEGTTKFCLASLVRRGLLTNRQDVRPKGYGLSEWD